MKHKIQAASPENFQNAKFLIEKFGFAINQVDDLKLSFVTSYLPMHIVVQLKNANLEVIAEV